MASDDKPRSVPRRAADAARSAAKPAERPFDMWLHKQLHAMYDEIASEPLPNELVNLIDRDAAEGGSADPSSAGKEKPGSKKN